MKKFNLALMWLLIISMGNVGQAGTNDLIFKSSFEPLFYVGGESSNDNVIIKLNQLEDYTIPAIGAYVIPYPIENGTDYSLEIIASPSGELCSVQNNSGTIADDNIVNADVLCGSRTTIYDVKQEFATGLVAIENVIVTACKESIGFWIQTIPGDADYIKKGFKTAFKN